VKERTSKLTRHTTGQNYRARSEIGAKQCGDHKSGGELEPKRRLRRASPQILGAKGGRERQTIWSTCAVFVKWLVVGMLAASASVWVVKASRPPALPDQVAIPAPQAVEQAAVREMEQANPVGRGPITTPEALASFTAAEERHRKCQARREELMHLMIAAGR
jgi:hypothetical protein